MKRSLKYPYCKSINEWYVLTYRTKLLFFFGFSKSATRLGRIFAPYGRKLKGMGWKPHLIRCPPCLQRHPPGCATDFPGQVPADCLPQGKPPIPRYLFSEAQEMHPDSKWFIFKREKITVPLRTITKKKQQSIFAHGFFRPFFLVRLPTAIRSILRVFGMD